MSKRKKINKKKIRGRKNPQSSLGMVSVSRTIKKKTKNPSGNNTLEKAPLRNKKALNRKAILYYQSLLEEIKEKVVNEIKQIANDTASPQKDAAGDVSGHALHMADVATDMYDREFSLGLASNDRELLQKVGQALKRIEENSYGLCTECDKPIAAARLKAIPYAPTCLKCQEELERK